MLSFYYFLFDWVMIMKKIITNITKKLLLLLTIIISGIMFNVCVYLGAGIATVFSIVVFSSIYFACQFFIILRYKGAERILFLSGSLILSIVFFLLSNDYHIFGVIFKAFNADYIKKYGKPNAGSGFGMIIAIILNGFAYALSAALGVIDLVKKHNYFFSKKE